MDAAFTQLMRINPKDISSYTSYAGCFLPQWGGSERKLEAIYAKAEAAFGKDSPDLYYLKASTLACYPEDVRPRDTILLLLNKGLSKCKTPDPDLLLMKSRVLFGLKRYDESEEIALAGTKQWDTLGWRYFLARNYEMHYQYKHDNDALSKAETIFAQYCKEVPYDPEGYVQWGWCLSHLGRREEAKEKFLKALDLDPGNEGATKKLKYVQ